MYFIGIWVEERHLHKQNGAWITEEAMMLMFHLILWLPVIVSNYIWLQTVIAYCSASISMCTIPYLKKCEVIEIV